ncbi:MAG: NTP transferase domain-containing protein [Elusimicrobia bacterium]|nr:NTP transferase domain-containing protein [Elusimicrobiota bacterium]
MRGVILAGGSGSRLLPLTRVTNKHLLPVYDRPMIYYPIEQLAGAGIDRIMIVTGGNHAGEFLRLLGNGSAFGLRHLDYAYQEGVGGIADALGLTEWFAGGEPIAVMLGDNIFEFSVAPIVRRFLDSPAGARIVLTEVDNPGSYGIAVMEDGQLVRVVEKPKDPPSRLAVTGLYLYDAGVFDLLKGLTPSARGELEITDVNNLYLKKGLLRYDTMPGYWADCGESIRMLQRAAELVAERGANKPMPAERKL